MNFARSRVGTRSPRIANGSDMSPPAPIPWTARNTTSWVMVCAALQRIEPRRNVTSATMKIRLRP